ncbi:lipoprotein [Streptomyces minutiscleroticus]|uniref:Lipoprotein n=1 Tax=Streptomyces minutiscleroticus TaxID=68238 RepID=A0A918K712_9ACTN|nr:lipoprotein [Streptomyces minutiscleroticus]
MTRTGVAALGAALLLTGCAGGGGGDAGAVPETATGSLEHLAAEVRCEPDMQTDADELRQAICENDDGKFVLATFATDRGQREWLNQAKDYGGSYLVGAKWVAVGEEEVVTALRGRLGGTVEEGTSHHSGNSGGGGDEATHSGHRSG